MGMFHNLKVGDQVINSIDWEMTPDLTFGTFESWGGRERVRHNGERIHYFFVDNWGDAPKLCLMERGVKHARIVAEIAAPLQLVKKCVERQGEAAFFERSYAIDSDIQQWLIDHVLDDGDQRLVHPVLEQRVVEDMGPRLPKWDQLPTTDDAVLLPSNQATLTDDEAQSIVKKWQFWDAAVNPAGAFENHLKQSGSHTLVDQRTGLMWQRHGLDINSIRTMHRKINEVNDKRFAGHSDWRLPSLEEAMSLMESVANEKGLHLNSNFSQEQPFIFVAAQRSPGGYWFVDYKQGRYFWSSGTIPGGFGRLCSHL